MPDAHSKVDPEDLFFVRLRQLRDAAGTPTYQAIAERAGMSPSTAHNVIRGHNLPRWDLVRSILAALDGSPKEFRPLYEDMCARARARGRGVDPAAATSCEACGCVIADPVIHLGACYALSEQRPHVALAMAPQIDEDSWLNEDRFAEFRAGYAYASSATNAIDGLSRITPEDAYYVHAIIQRGIERYRAEQADRPSA